MAHDLEAGQLGLAVVFTGALPFGAIAPRNVMGASGGQPVDQILQVQLNPTSRGGKSLVTNRTRAIADSCRSASLRHAARPQIRGSRSPGVAQCRIEIRMAETTRPQVQRAQPARAIRSATYRPTTSPVIRKGPDNPAGPRSASVGSRQQRPPPGRGSGAGTGDEIRDAFGEPPGASEAVSARDA